jgi:hypothetical protein
VGNGDRERRSDQWPVQACRALESGGEERGRRFHKIRKKHETNDKEERESGVKEETSGKKKEREKMHY